MFSVLAITGLPGSGKSFSARYFSANGFFYVRMGDLTDDIIEEKGEVFSEKLESQIRKDLRKSLGKSVYARAIVHHVKMGLEERGKVVIDGLRTVEEYDLLKKEFQNIKILYLFSDSALRYKRMSIRKVRKLDKKNSMERDKDEIANFDFDRLRKISDFEVDNDSGEDELKKKLSRIARLI